MKYIEKSTLDFLKKLSENNERKWFDLHRDEYKKARENFVAFFSEVAYEVSLQDPYLIDTKSDTHIFRINRDTRFSRNKLPYKTNFWAFLSPGGKKYDNLSAGYYLHIEPGNNFIGWWAYRPESEYLEKIREKIVDNPKDFKKIINNSRFKKVYSHLSEMAKLKTAPRWYPRDHPEIDILRHKNFTSTVFFTDKEVLEEWFQQKVVETLSLLAPLNNWFNEIQ